MKKVDVNPIISDAQYVNYLNQCFGHWGTTENFTHIFKRESDPIPADLILITEGDEVLAGSAVVYRKIHTADGNHYTIGIMTGSWTLPAARKKGCFTTMIETSKDLCEERDAAFLTAFVVETNPSKRRLENAGSYMLPTAHYKSKFNLRADINPVTIEKLPVNEKNLKNLYQNRQQFKNSFTGFDYTEQAFKDQFVLRRDQLQILKIMEIDILIAEDDKQVKILNSNAPRDQKLNLIHQLAHYAEHKKQKELFFYTSDASLISTINPDNFEAIPGYFTVLPAKVKHPSIPKDLKLELGDKI